MAEQCCNCKINESPEGKLDFTIREANPHDLTAIRRMLAAAGRPRSSKAVFRWLSQNEYVVRLVCRFNRYPVGICVLRVLPDATTVLALHVAPPYAGRKIETVLLSLAASELPERPTVMTVSADDASTAEHLRAAQWRVTGINSADDAYTFTAPPPGGGCPGGSCQTAPAPRSHAQ